MINKRNTNEKMTQLGDIAFKNFSKKGKIDDLKLN